MILQTAQTNRTATILSAHVVWEDVDRNPIVVRITADDEGALLERGEAFLPLAAIAAQLYGERRLATDATASPLFLEGLPVALAWSRFLLGTGSRPLDVQVPVDPRPPGRRPVRHAMFFSGGVDSMATLRANQQLVPAGHPHRISELIFIEGFEEVSSDLALEAARAGADEAGLPLLVVSTNLAEFDTASRKYWQQYLYGAFLASVANALALRFHRITVPPSSGSIGRVKPVGSLPQIDTNLSSDLVQIGHPHFHTSRSERIASIVDWDVARRWLRPCSKRAGGNLNCGRCEKCVPTMLSIVATGADLREFPAFGCIDLDPDRVAQLRVFDRSILDDMVAQRSALGAAGRSDLVRAVESNAAEFVTWDEWRRQALRDVERVVPDRDGIQAIDLGQFELDGALGVRTLVPHWFVDTCDGHDGRRHTVNAFTEGLAAGAPWVVIFSSAFWWFESYPWLEDLLLDLGEEALCDDRIRIYRLS